MKKLVLLLALCSGAGQRRRNHRAAARAAGARSGAEGLRPCQEDANWADRELKEAEQDLEKSPAAAGTTAPETRSGAHPDQCRPGTAGSGAQRSRCRLGGAAAIAVQRKPPPDTEPAPMRATNNTTGNDRSNP